MCEGACEHVELRADRTAIFLGSLGDEWAEVSYEIEAQLPGTFHAMPARAEAMYDSRCAGSSAAFSLTVEG